MRFFYWKTLRAVAVFVCVAFSLCVATVARVSQVCRFSAIEGERTFYLYSASSQAIRKSTLTLRDCLFVKGESVQFFHGGEDAGAVAERIARAYGATITYTETACGTISYYAYVPNGWESVTLNGARINLHIAVNGEVCAVGTPVIFGGF